MSRFSPAEAPPGLVALGHGPADQVRALLLESGPALAVALALPWAGCLDPAQPETGLTALPAALVGLPLDPGQSLPRGGHWAEILAAHRQPALVVLSVGQVSSGVAAASVALLSQEGVPLLGVVQWGGPWDAALRRREGLPWLGWLTAGAAGEGETAVQLGLAARLRQAQRAAAQG